MGPHALLLLTVNSGDDELMSPGSEERDGVTFTHLDQELFDGANATKRDMIEYLDAVE